MAYRVEILPRAQQDLDAITAWLLERSPLNGSVWLFGLETAILSLGDLPERCPVAGKLSTSTSIIRQLLYGRYPHVYKIYFRIVSGVVEVLHVRHSARRQPAKTELP